jgi:hypothetical protein
VTRSFAAAMDTAVARHTHASFSAVTEAVRAFIITRPMARIH